MCVVELLLALIQFDFPFREKKKIPGHKENFLKVNGSYTYTTPTVQPTTHYTT